MRKLISAILMLASLTVVAIVLSKQSQTIQLTISPDQDQQFTFDIHYQSSSLTESSSSSLIPIGSDSQNVSIDFRARMDWFTVGHDQHANSYLFRLFPVHEESNETAKRLFESELSARVTVTHNGQITQILMPATYLEGSSLIMTDILRQFMPRLSQQAVARKGTWTSKEVTGSGQSVSALWRLEDFSSDHALISRDYLKDSPSTPMKMNYEIDRRSQFPVSVSVDIRNMSSNSNQKIVSSLKFDAKLVNQFQVKKEDLDKITSMLQAEPLVTENLNNERLMEVQQREAYRRVLGNETPESMRSQLEAATPDNQNSNMKTYNKLKALFALNPRSVELFASALQDYDRLDDRFSMVATALTAVGTPEAQKVLRDAIQSISDETKKQRLIPNLSFSRYPTLESEAFLRDLAMADESSLIRATAHRAMGTVAHNLRSQDQDRAKAIFQDYDAALKHSQNKSDITQNLDVLGNIGIVDQLQSVEPFLKHGDPEIRERAYNSLRHVQSSKATQILFEALSTEQVPKTREVISEAISFQTFEDPSWIETTKTAIYAEKNIAVVKHLLRTLSQHVEEFPAARGIIEQYSKDCGHPDLCGYVKGLAEALKSKQ